MAGYQYRARRHPWAIVPDVDPAVDAEIDRMPLSETRKESRAWDANALKPCGTPAAYKRHLYRGEKPDEACL